MTIEGSQLIRIRHQESGQEEEMKQVDIQRSSADILQGLRQMKLLLPRYRKTEEGEHHPHACDSTDIES